MGVDSWTGFYFFVTNSLFREASGWPEVRGRGEILEELKSRV